MLIHYQIIIVNGKNKERKYYVTPATQKKKINLALYFDCFDLRWSLSQIGLIVR
jgi:hypothetical protein